MLDNARFLRALALFAVGVLLVSCGTLHRPKPVIPQNVTPVVKTQSGPIRGAFADDYRLYAGIPYAAPPEGDLRWRPPAPPEPWDDVRDASKFGSRCVQDPAGDPDFGRAKSEDCLTLNVWVPRRGSAKAMPVMVWIHGGAFVNGSGDIYDPRWILARNDIIVVTFNYRLGALGFLAHPALADDGGQIGNYGFSDQQAALRWVHDNIASFGGDPANVTVAGESAGAMSVCDHLVAPGSAGLFRAAIIMSGPCQAQGTRSGAEQVSRAYAESVGCGDAAEAAECLRALPADKLVAPPLYYQLGLDGITGPVTGTAELPVDPMGALADGRGAPVPVLIGTNRDEFTLFVALQYLAFGRMPDYPAVLGETFGADSARIAERYPLDRFGGNPALAYAAVITDWAFACPAIRMADGQQRLAPVFGYQFNDRDAPAPEPLRTVPFPVGASHSLELRYLFDIVGAPAMNDAQQTLSHRMIDYWAGFVRDGVPRADGAPAWPPLSEGGQWLSLETPQVRTATDFGQANQCDFWAGLKTP